MLEPYGIREMVQSGMVALGRGAKSMTQAGLRSRDDSGLRAVGGSGRPA